MSKVLACVADVIERWSSITSAVQASKVQLLPFFSWSWSNLICWFDFSKNFISDSNDQDDTKLPHFRPEALDTIRMEDLIKEYLTSKENVCDFLFKFV